MPRIVREQAIEHSIGPAGRFRLRVTDPVVRLRTIPGGVARVQVRFELSADSEAGADEAFERVRYDVHAGAGVLEVVEPKLVGTAVGSIARIFGIGSPRIATSVVVEVPAGAEVDVEGVSSDIDAAGPRGRQQYRSVSGDLRLVDVGGDLRVRGVSSDISLRAEAPVRLELNTVSGDVSAVAPRFDALRIMTVSGDVDLEGALTSAAESRIETVSGDLQLGVVGGVTIEVRALSSDVDVSLPHRTEGTRDRRRYVIGDGSASVVFRSMSGDLSAHAPRRLSPIPPAPSEPPAPPISPSEPPARPNPHLAILLALERGEISVDEAVSRLAARATDA